MRHMAVPLRALVSCIALLLALPCSRIAAQSTWLPCGPLVGGGFMKVHEFDVVFSATADSTGSTVHGFAIVRAPREFLSHRPITQQPPRAGGGSRVGALWVVHDERGHSVWLDSLEVPLKDNNNVLLVEVDAHGTPRVAGQARIEPRVPVKWGACDGAAMLGRYQQVVDTLWARFRASPRVQSFISP
jgi:hypothetical protein